MVDALMVAGSLRRDWCGVISAAFRPVLERRGKVGWHSIRKMLSDMRSESAFSACAFRHIKRATTRKKWIIQRRSIAGRHGTSWRIKVTWRNTAQIEGGINGSAPHC